MKKYFFFISFILISCNYSESDNSEQTAPIVNQVNSQEKEQATPSVTSPTSTIKIYDFNEKGTLEYIDIEVKQKGDPLRQAIQMLGLYHSKKTMFKGIKIQRIRMTGGKAIMVLGGSPTIQGEEELKVFKEVIKKTAKTYYSQDFEIELNGSVL